mmetsp:Transcript_47464/g.82909  ORF Transcript_47464/g.82909 Transcript_47464/m.82909 type:complete len:245 (+) Transcript_47464:1324-2058(+)
MPCRATTTHTAARPTRYTAVSAQQHLRISRLCSACKKRWLSLVAPWRTTLWSRRHCRSPSGAPTLDTRLLLPHLRRHLLLRSTRSGLTSNSSNNMPSMHCISNKRCRHNSRLCCSSNCDGRLTSRPTEEPTSIKPKQVVFWSPRATFTSILSPSCTIVARTVRITASTRRMFRLFVASCRRHPLQLLSTEATALSWLSAIMRMTSDSPILSLRTKQPCLPLRPHLSLCPPLISSRQPAVLQETK